MDAGARVAVSGQPSLLRLVAMRQKDLNQLLGNSSVAHMGFVFLGIASLTTIGLNGAVMVMVAHGLLAALVFGLSGHCTPTRARWRWTRSPACCAPCRSGARH